MSIESKYLKYKNKYLKLKKQLGSGDKIYEYGRIQKFDCNKKLSGITDINQICSLDVNGYYTNKEDCTFSDYCLNKWRIDNTYLPIIKQNISYDSINPIMTDIINQNISHDSINPIKCEYCKNSIISEEHLQQCNTVMMWEIQKYDITSNFKPLMTFGLNGCTAILMVFFNKENNNCVRVVLGHHPEKDRIIEWYNKYYTIDFNIVTIIKSPGELIKENEKWIMKTEDEKFYSDNIKNCKLIFEPYDMKNIPFNSFNKSLYFNIYHNVPYYTDNNGNHIKIKYLED